jgi:ribosomal protein S18 acetylase RimI-like enzyme
MQISDYDAVMKLWRDCEGLSLRDADSASGVEKYLERNPGLSFVALDGTRIVGSIMAGHDGKRGYIQHLAVGEELRGLGVASELVGRCLSALKSQGIEKSHVHVLKDNNDNA